MSGPASSKPRLFAQRSALPVGALCVALAGLGWAAFAHQLHGDGHVPSRVLLPMARESYYRVQALFILPVLLGLWALLAGVAYHLTGGRGRGLFAHLAGALGVAYGLPLLLCFVAPEWFIYERYGIEGLRVAFRYTMPLAGLSTWGAATYVLHSRRRVPWRRALGVAWLALLIQALVGAPFLR